MLAVHADASVGKKSITINGTHSDNLVGHDHEVQEGIRIKSFRISLAKLQSPAIVGADGRIPLIKVELAAVREYGKLSV